MKRLLHFLAHNRPLARAGLLLLSLGVALAFGWLDLRGREQTRLSLLQTEAQRSGIEIMSQTLNGNLMGSITLLGLTDRDIKQEASNGLLSQDAHIGATLSTLGNAFLAEGVFVVGQDGIVKSSWDRVNKPSTGLNVQFRPYYQMAMRGQNSVYAAVSMARGDRSMYFAAPVFSEQARSTSGIGAVVARTNLDNVDALLRDKFDISVLLSPQGVVFASNLAEWIGFIDSAPTPERLRAIRELKQFGAMFEKTEPQVLPLQADADFQIVAGRRYAVARARVAWNDPSGHWRLLVLEDLNRSVPIGPSAGKAAGAGVVSLLLGWLLLHLLRSRQAQAAANAQLQDYARAQEASLAYRERLAEASVQLQRCASAGELGQCFLREARDMLGAPQAALYVHDDAAPGRLVLLACSAAATTVPESLEAGQGLLGQCALDGQTRVIDTPQDGYWNLRSGLGHARPAALVITALMRQGSVQGVLELALTQVPTPARLQELQAMVEMLSMNLEILRRHARAPADDPAPATVEAFE